MEKAKRIYRDDNLKFLLIFLVVFGHFMELFSTPNILYLQKFIYSFHMPVFMFISGKHAKFNSDKIFKKLIIPYFIFQILYICFLSFIKLMNFYMQFTVPIWIMWYMLSLIIYYLLIPMLPQKIKPAIILICISFILSIIVGFDNYIGRYLSLSRTICFFPFFLIGFYFNEITKSFKLTFKVKGCLLFVFGIIFVLCEYYILNNVSLNMLYSADSYETCESSFIGRIVFMLASFAALILLYSIIPNIKISIITQIGQNTLTIFLLHGFINRYLKYIGFFHYTSTQNLIISLLFTALIVLILGNSLLNNLINKIFKR